MVYMSIVNNWKTVFFFFKQKTAYEMRISDWSSDVCSSDLHIVASAPVLFIGHERQKVAENKTLWKDNLVGERGFEPPAPASRRRISPPHMAVFRDITGGFPRISLRLFPLDSRFRGSKGSSLTLEHCLNVRAGKLRQQHPALVTRKEADRKGTRLNSI